MTPDRKMLDLFSGLGGASESFLNNGWEVKRVENNMLLKNVPNTTICDVQQLENQLEIMMQHSMPTEKIDFIWASPPCTDFSVAYSSPRSKAYREGQEYYPAYAIELVQCAKRIIDMLQPTYWCIENVRGSCTWLKEILGEPRKVVGPFVFWGNFPHLDLPPNYTHKKFENDTWSTDPLRANKRALVPYEISNAFRCAIESQKTLSYWW